MAKEKLAETPLMKQHKDIKAKYPDAVLLFRVGDFYETFNEKQNTHMCHVQDESFPFVKSFYKEVISNSENLRIPPAFGCKTWITD